MELSLQYVDSGVASLNYLLRGGIPVAPSIVVSGSEKDIYNFSQRLVWNRLISGDLCLYGTIFRTREDVIADLNSKGWDITSFLRTGELRIVDYLALVEKEPGTPEQRLNAILSMGTEALSLEKFYEVFMREFLGAREGRSNKRLFAIFDSIDKLVEASGMENTIRFAETTMKILRETNSIGVGLLCNEFLSEEILERTKKIASLFIELKEQHEGKEDSHILRIVKSEREVLTNSWIPWYY